MKLFISLGLCLLSPLLALATPTPVANADVMEIRGLSPGGASGAVFWPESAAAHMLGRRHTTRNSERLQRGLTPSRPRKLYTSEVKKDTIEKRVLSAPSRGVDSVKTYTFRGCGTAIIGNNGRRVTTLTYANLQSLADQCAAQQDAQTTGTDLNFYIVDRAVANCYSGITGRPDQTCDNSNAAYYTPDS